MKVRQISNHIWGLHSWMIVKLQVWLVDTGDGLVLVDAGIGSMAKGILKTVEELNRGPLQSILLTHGHSDHVGAVPHILKEHNIPVYAHGIEIPYAHGELAYPRRKKAVASVQPGTLTPLPNDEQGLAPIHGLMPYHTPGHAPGHVAYYHAEDKVLLGGDSFTSKRGTLNRPMPIFTADMPLAIESGRIVKELRPDILAICHSGDVLRPHEQYDAYRQRWLNA